MPGYLDQKYGKTRKPAVSLPKDGRLFNEAIGLPIHPVTNLPSPLLPYQIDIDAYPGKDILIIKANKCGITEIMLRKIIRMAVVGDLQGYDIILGSSEEQLAMENMRRAQVIFGQSSLLRPLVKEATASKMILRNSTRFLTLPSNAAAIRSWPRVKCVFLDEAAHIGRLDDTEYFAAASSRLANTNGYMYVVSTPHGPRGFFYDLYTKAIEGKIQMKKFELPYTVGLGVFYDQEFIDKERSRLGPLFQQEYEGSFISGRNAAIEPELLEHASEDYEPEAW